MSTEEQSNTIVERQQVAAEVLERGQAPFDAMLMFAEMCLAQEDGEAFPAEDVRRDGQVLRALQVFTDIGYRNTERG